jgi:hypothetical protein
MKSMFNGVNRRGKHLVHNPDDTAAAAAVCHGDVSADVRSGLLAGHYGWENVLR